MRAKITALHASGHGFRFFADSLDEWPKPIDAGDYDADGWFPVYMLHFNAPASDLAQAMQLAEQLFTVTNTHPEWHSTVGFLSDQPDARRSLSVADVVRVEFEDGNTFNLGCDSCGFRTLEA